MNRLSTVLVKNISTKAIKQAGYGRFLASVATVEKAKVPSRDGDRLVVTDEMAGNPILVAKVGDAFYAVENNCPHMNVSLERGNIYSDTTDEPEIRCAYHNSRFGLKTGTCTKWVTGAMGFESKLVGGVVQKIGGNKRDLKAYQVTENDDGSLTIDDTLSSQQ